MNKRVYPILIGQPQGESRSKLCFERGIKNKKDFLAPPFLHQIQKFDTLARKQSRFDSSHKWNLERLLFDTPLEIPASYKLL